VLGLVAVVVAAESVSALLGQNPVTDLLVDVMGRTEAAQFVLYFVLLTGVALVAVVLGVIAAITGRGRWWGVAAIALAVVGNIQFLELMRVLVAHTG
jgi:hypothetical protein